MAALLLLLLLGASLGSATHVVRTRQGAARGTGKASSAGLPFLAFYNLPYAKPPVGRLRFKSPQTPDTWEHIRDATTPGPSCTQNAFNTASPTGTEDCLYLNIFTPKLKAIELLPVMFWIHGGGWMMGGGTWVEPDFLLDHNIVLVTINYRLGPLGFLSTEDEAAPGNFGLKDQVAALRWVKENIEAFGGDPGRVTIFGNSAGAASVHYLMLSPLSRGLFHRAVSQSGVALVPWAVPLAGAARKARKVAALLGCPTESSTALVECLRGVDDYELTATELQFQEWFFNPIIPFRAAVEGEGEHSFLPKHPLYMEPHTAIPWLVGVTKDEGCLQTGAFVSNGTLLQDLVQDMEKFLSLSLLYHFLPQAKLITEKIRSFYFPSDDLSIRKFTEIYTDGLFVWNTDEAIRKYKDSAPVYFYLFSYEGKNKMSVAYGAQEENLGVCHADELFYLFSNNTHFPALGERLGKDMELAKLMTKLWTNFAETGNPTPNHEPLRWPRVTSDGDLEYLEIGQKLEVKKGLFQERIDFWRSLPLREAKQQSVAKEEL